MVFSALCDGSLFRGMFLFGAWTGLSFFAHNFARQVFRSADIPPSYNEMEFMWCYVLAVTFIQTATGSAVLFATKTVQNIFFKSKSQASLDSGPYLTKTVLSTLAITHAVATTSTNASIAFSSATSALVIKAFEPITTALLAAIISGKRLETHVIISLPLAIIGAIGFTWRSDLQFTELLGMSIAVISNIMFGIRNLGIKHYQENSHAYSAIGNVHVLAVMSWYSSLLLALILASKTYSIPDALPFIVNAKVLQGSLSSGIFHVSYTIFSVIMLAMLTAGDHATSSLWKRTILSALFYLISWHIPSLSNIIFGGVYVIGIIIFLSGRKLKLMETQEFQSLLLSIIIASFIVFSAINPTSIDDNNVDFLQLDEQNVDKLFPTNKTILDHHEKKLDFIEVNDQNDDKLFPNYKTVLDQEEERFLKVDLFHYNDRADWLSKRLPVAYDVIKEAQRIHYHLFSRLLKGYRRAVLVNMFTWPNRGDHAITGGERKVMADFNITLEYYCFFREGCNFKGIAHSSDLIVFLQGGGYIGDFRHIPNILEAVSAFPNNRIMFFPMSISKSEATNLEVFYGIFKNHSDFWLLLRDRHSYELVEYTLYNEPDGYNTFIITRSMLFHRGAAEWDNLFRVVLSMDAGEKQIAKTSFPSTKCLLSPDIAFALGPQRFTMFPTHDIIWVKRHDWEIYNDTKHDVLPNIPSNITALIRDWDPQFLKQKGSYYLEDMQFWLISGFVYLAQGKVVISDRLHAHLMSTLLEIPNVLVNSNTRKQQHYYDTWHSSIRTSVCVDSANEAFNVATNFNHAYP